MNATCANPVPRRRARKPLLVHRLLTRQRSVRSLLSHFRLPNARPAVSILGDQSWTLAKRALFGLECPVDLARASQATPVATAARTMPATMKGSPTPTKVLVSPTGSPATYSARRTPFHLDDPQVSWLPAAPALLERFLRQRARDMCIRWAPFRSMTLLACRNTMR